MKKHWYLLIPVCALMACNHSNEAIKKRISGADSVAINYFRGDGTMDTVVSVKIVSDPKRIAQLSSFISQRTIAYNHKCGYDGSLHFFKMNQVVEDIDFRMAGDDCMLFSFLQDGRTVATALSEEAEVLIKSFR